MNIVFHEFRANLRSLVIWMGCMVVLVFMMLTEFSAYYNNPEMTAILDSIPSAFLDAFGMQGANLTTVSGFVSVMALYFQIMLGIFAVLLGHNMIAKEEGQRTGEFLMTMPITRIKAVISKLMVAVVNCVLLVIATSISVVIGTWSYSPDAHFYRFLTLVFVTIFLLQLVFLSMGFLFAAVIKQPKLSGGLAVGSVIVTYLLSVLVALSDSLDFLKYVTPFKYFEANQLLRDMSISSIYLLLTVSIIVLAIAISFFVYTKRDLKI